MTIDEMYNELRQQMREKNITAIVALHNVLQKCQVETLPLTKSENNLYVRIDNIPFRSVEIINFLANANGLNVSFTAFLTNISDITHVGVPYLKIFKQ